MPRMILAAALILSTTAAVMSQEMPANVRAVINEHYIGDWDFQMTTPEGTTKGTYETKWAPGKYCVLISETSEGPTGKIQSSGILAWQPDSKTIVHHGFISNGDYYRITYDKYDGNKWSGRVTGLVNGERPEPSNATVVWEEGEFHYKDNIVDFKATRKADLRAQWISYFEGSWKRARKTWNAEDGWKESTEEWSGKLVSGALIATGKDSDGFKSVVVFGPYDYGDGILEYGSDTSGMNWTISISHIEKDRIVGEARGVLPDGRKAQGKTVIERKSEDAYVAETVVKAADGATFKFLGDNKRQR